MNPEEWRSRNLDRFFLTPEEPWALEAYLSRRNWLEKGEELVRTEEAGDGNMNCTVRAVTDRRSIIVKQSRPWVEKYPQFEAPWDRALREIEFYEWIQADARIAEMMPKRLFADAVERLLGLEDLGAGSDFTGIYGGEEISEEDLDELARYLSLLHGCHFEPEDRGGLANREMRELNRQHIFRIPLERENGLDLDDICPGLARVAGLLRGDHPFVSAVHEWERLYLADGDHLLHGDFFPGSVLRTASGPRVIDPEFAFFGCPEFDVGVFVAHLLLGRQVRGKVERFLGAYRAPDGFDLNRVSGFAGVEIMRRLMGFAQLPLTHGLDERTRLLERARGLVLLEEPLEW